MQNNDAVLSTSKAHHFQTGHMNLSDCPS